MPTESQPNVLFIVLDTARARTVFSGLDRDLMPTVSRLAAEGTTFTDATTTGPWTLPSHASMFTGQYTSEHGSHAGNRSFDPAGVPLSTRLSGAGYRTAGISGNVWISPEFGFDAGFDQFSMKWDLFWDAPDLSSVISGRNTVSDESSLLDAFRGHTPVELLKGGVTAGYAKYLAGRHDDGARNATTRTVNWLEEHASDEQPFFYFLNYIEPHLPYEPPESFQDEYLPAGVSPEDVNQDPWAYVAGDVEMDERDFEVLQGLYEAELAYVDTQIERLYEALDEAGVLDETAIVLVGDHGENIGDHDLMDHQYCLYETLVNVPLVIRYPEAFPAGERVSGPVELRDLYPTIQDFADESAETMDATSEHSLRPRDGDVPTREYALSEYLVPQPSMDSLRESVDSFDPAATKYDRALRSIRSERWKLVEASDDTVELYDLRDDPHEQTDRSDERPSVVERLQERLRDRLGPLTRGATDDGDISQHSKERLEDLGYLQ
jgi:arylsulfatase A-like enzyme